MPLEIVQGETVPVPLQLEDDGVKANIGATALIELRLRNRWGKAVNTAADVIALSSSTGRVNFNPDLADLRHVDSPYRARIWVTENGVTRAYPNSQADTWTVYAG